MNCWQHCHLNTDLMVEGRRKSTLCNCSLFFFFWIYVELTFNVNPSNVQLISPYPTSDSRFYVSMGFICPFFLYGRLQTKYWLYSICSWLFMGFSINLPIQNVGASCCLSLRSCIDLNKTIYLLNENWTVKNGTTRPKEWSGHFLDS